MNGFRITFAPLVPVSSCHKQTDIPVSVGISRIYTVCNLTVRSRPLIYLIIISSLYGEYNLSYRVCLTDSSCVVIY